MPYSYPNDIPTYAKKKSKAVQKVSVEVFNSTFKETKSEAKARIASLAAMKNAEASESKIKKSLDSIQLLNKSNEELMQVTYVCMQEGTDAHGDYTSVDEIRKAKESFNKALRNGSKLSNLFHITSTNAFEIEESYLAPCDMQLGDHLIQKDSWLVKLQINKGYEDLWEGIKAGDYVGVSIGALATVQKVNSETTDDSADEPV